MIQKTLAKINILLIAAAILPSGIFSIPSASASSLNQDVHETNIVVRQAEPKQTVVVVEGQPFLAKTFSCSIVVSSGANLVQDAQSVNLNQPANCFTLNLAKLAVAPALSVIALSHQETSIVVKKAVPWLKSSQLEAKSQSSDSSLPIAAISIVIIVLYERKKIAQKIATKLATVQAKLTLQQLQVMRC